MTPLDKAMLALVRTMKELDDACPDAGMGPGFQVLMDDAMDRAGVTIDQFDYHRVLAKFIGDRG